jgi:hypothetical protein
MRSKPRRILSALGLFVISVVVYSLIRLYSDTEDHVMVNGSPNEHRQKRIYSEGKDNNVDNSYLSARNLNRMLASTDSDLVLEFSAMDESKRGSIMNALGLMISSDIKSRGNYNLAKRLVKCLSEADAARILQWVFQSKSPLGCEYDFSEQTELLQKFKKESQQAFLRTKFSKSFGMMHGEDVAAAQKELPLGKNDCISYLDGVCGTTREAAFANLLLIHDKSIQNEAVQFSVRKLLDMDAEGTSSYIAKMQPSNTKDLILLQMINWLILKNAKQECFSWLEQIESSEIRSDANEIIQGK